MKYLASGWQFDVYSDGEQVEKRPSPVWRIASRVVRNYPSLAVRPRRLVARARDIARRRESTVKDLFAREIDRGLLANVHQADGKIIQDLVTSLGDCLQRGDDAPMLIDAYIDSIHEGWRAGFAETSFNFTVNHGLTDDGKVVVIDIGELTFDRGDARQLIDVEFWRGAYSLRVLSQEHREYAMQSFRTRLTRAHLMALWQDADLHTQISVAPDRPAVAREERAPNPLVWQEREAS